ncbi:helicase C-terminal domain-containing protein [Luedemannella helvata]|uniref:Helicase XPB/Ssl2 N-terminal domain-containing protein n=1 Tax=Luedemannella helvata TaxID=349315 RepID=A0ABP4W4I9_9ACTN
MTYPDLGTWLSSLDADALARIVANRAEARLPRPARTLTELVARLSRRSATLTALYTSHTPATQVVEMVAALDVGPAAPLAQLAAGLGVTPDDPELARVLDWLADRALAWRVGDVLCVPPALLEAFPQPHRLGPPVEYAYNQLTARDLHGIATAWRLPAGRTKREVLAALVAAAADGAAVRAVVAAAPAGVRDFVTHVAWHGPAVSEQGYTRTSGTVRDDVVWGLRNGLFVPDDWDTAVMPAEIAMALRGPDWRPPFDPHPPAARTAPVAADALRRESAAAATSALERAGAVLGAAALAPVALLKSGGVGSRELKRLAKASGTGPGDVRLWLEIGYTGGLLAIEETSVLATEAYDRWLRAEPADRLATLAAAWWQLPAAPTGTGAGGGAAAWVGGGGLTATSAAPADTTSTPALLRDATGTVLVMLRQAVLRAVAALAPGESVADPADVARLVRWQVPAVMDLLPDGDAFTCACWQEAGTLGIVAHGALTPLGAALAADDPGALRAAGRDLLGTATTSATFQADLTVVVPGSPAGDLADLLDSAADRESRGGASVWRFSAASVRRALDAGTDGPALTAALTAASTTGALPQPLTYLIADAGRRHGEVRVRAVGCVLHSADASLLAEVAKARPLARLGLVPLAPTVLTSAAGPAETVAALRSAGYAPAAEDATGAIVVDRPSPRRASPTAWSEADLGAAPIAEAAPEDPTAPEIAAAILAGPPLEPSRRATRGPRPARVPGQTRRPGLVDDLDELDGDDAHDLLHELIGAHARGLSDQEICLLADALTAEESVKITYRDAEGDVTHRVIEPLALDGHVLEAWCRLRDDERVFALSRISSVTPA